MSRPRWRGSKPAQREKLRRVQANRCGICPRELNGTVEVDHIRPRSAGGPDTWHNLHLVHRYCNRRKGVSSLAAVRAQLTLFDERFTPWSQIPSQDDHRQTMRSAPTAEPTPRHDPARTAARVSGPRESRAAALNGAPLVAVVRVPLTLF